MTDHPPDWLPTDLHSAYRRFTPLLAGIRWLVLDVDGVMTNGAITYSSDGTESKTFNVKDGQGLSLMPHVGISTGILTARQSPIIDIRAKELGFTEVCQGAKPKLPALLSRLAPYNVSMTQVAYMGDDWPDCAVLRQAGFAACPADAIPAVQQCAHWVSPRNGGYGAVRDVCDLLLAVNGFSPDHA